MQFSAAIGRRNGAARPQRRRVRGPPSRTDASDLRFYRSPHGADAASALSHGCACAGELDFCATIPGKTRTAAQARTPGGPAGKRKAQRNAGRGGAESAREGGRPPADKAQRAPVRPRAATAGRTRRIAVAQFSKSWHKSAVLCGDRPSKRCRKAAEAASMQPRHLKQMPLPCGFTEAHTAPTPRLPSRTDALAPENSTFVPSFREKRAARSRTAAPRRPRTGRAPGRPSRTPSRPPKSSH